MGAGGGSPGQAACLRQILLLQLDLIEQQQQQLQAKEKEIEELKAERDTLLARIERMERRVQLVKKDTEREKHRIFQGFEVDEKAEAEVCEKLPLECPQELLEPSQTLQPKHFPYGRNGKGHKRKPTFGSAERKTPVKKLVSEFSKVKGKTLKHSPVKEESSGSLSETVCKRELRSQETPEKTRSLLETPLRPSAPLKGPSSHPKEKGFFSEIDDLPYLSTTEMYLCRWHQPPPSPLPLREPSPKKEETVASKQWRACGGCAGRAGSRRSIACLRSPVPFPRAGTEQHWMQWRYGADCPHCPSAPGPFSGSCCLCRAAGQGAPGSVCAKPAWFPAQPVCLFEQNVKQLPVCGWEMCFWVGAVQCDMFVPRHSARAESLPPAGPPLVGVFLQTPECGLTWGGESPELCKVPSRQVEGAQWERGAARFAALPVACKHWIAKCHVSEEETSAFRPSASVPSWRDHVVEPLRDPNPSDILENLDDSVFSKRHAKLELDEKRRKRWDIQRIREQRILQRLQLRMYKRKGIQESEPEVTSFFPEPDDVESLLITPYLPVVAFGRPLPKLTPQNFELPWLDERSRCRLEVQKKQTPHRTCRK